MKERLEHIMIGVMILLCGTLILMATGCKTHEKSREREVRTTQDTVRENSVSRDTIYRERVIEKTRPVKNRVVVEKPCDSIGNLLPFNYMFGSGNNQSSLISKNGKLYFNQRLDSIRNVFEKRYRSRWESDSLALRRQIYKEIKSETDTKRTVWPWWIYAGIIVFGLLLIYNLLKFLKVV